jgi:hypothetical protein
MGSPMRPSTLITTVVTPSASTLLTDLASVKNELQITSTANDAFLKRLIAIASAAIQR